MTGQQLQGNLRVSGLRLGITCAWYAQAYDLSTTRVVAAKVHQLNPGWSEGRKASYVKHAIREVDIQKVRERPVYFRHTMRMKGA
jgi:hypothetical protein